VITRHSTKKMQMNDEHLIKRTDIAAMISMFFFACSATIIPICLVTITKDLSISLTKASILNFITSMELMLTLLLSCYLSARFGKIKLIRFSLLITGLGLSLVSLCHTFWHLLIVFIFVGIGSGFMEGIVTPIIEDLHPGDGGKKMNLVHAFWPFGVCTTLLLVGELLSRGISWRYMFPGLGLFIILITSLYPASRKLTLPRSRADFKHTRELFAKPRFWFLGMALFFAGGAEGGFAFWTASYIQIHFHTLPRAGGIGAALFAVGMMIGRFLTSRLAYKIKLKHLLLFFAFCSFIVSILFFLLIPTLYLVFAFMIAMGFTIACLWPSIQSYSSSVLQADPTMVMIYIACFGVTGYSTATLFMGIIGDIWNLRYSFIIAPVYCAFLLILIGLEGKITLLLRRG
jgi:fucose permease